MHNSDFYTWISFVAFCSFGYCGANFGAALTYQVCTYVHVCMYVCLYLCLYVRLGALIYLCVFVRACVCVHKCVVVVIVVITFVS
jgi:hypothetical protein